MKTPDRSRIAITHIAIWHLWQSVCKSNIAATSSESSVKAAAENSDKGKTGRYRSDRYQKVKEIGPKGGKVGCVAADKNLSAPRNNLNSQSLKKDVQTCVDGLNGPRPRSEIPRKVGLSPRQKINNSPETGNAGEGTVSAVSRAGQQQEAKSLKTRDRRVR